MGSQTPEESRWHDSHRADRSFTSESGRDTKRGKVAGGLRPRTPGNHSGGLRPDDAPPRRKPPAPCPAEGRSPAKHKAPSLPRIHSATGSAGTSPSTTPPLPQLCSMSSRPTPTPRKEPHHAGCPAARGALPVFRRQWPGRGAQRHPGRAGQVPPRVVGSSVGKRGRQAGRAGSRRGHSSLADGVSSGVTETMSRVRSSLNQRKRPGAAQTYSKYKCSRKNLGSP